VGWRDADLVFGLLIIVVVRNSALDIYRMDAVDPTLVKQVEQILAGQPLLNAIAERIRARMGDRAPRRYLALIRVGRRAD
jgi:hypothetical protein